MSDYTSAAAPGGNPRKKEGGDRPSIIPAGAAPLLEKFSITYLPIVTIMTYPPFICTSKGIINLNAISYILPIGYQYHELALMNYGIEIFLMGRGDQFILLADEEAERFIEGLDIHGIISKEDFISLLRSMGDTND